ncbi:MAG: hypothetical protein Q8P41_31945 [Pseudomonadota bacterium]|nr:hypothetical protein [Pseudomonadota bacterium]
MTKGFPVVFRGWTVPGPDAVHERFFADLRAGRGWYPPDQSPVTWLAELATEHPAALPVAERITAELLDAKDPAWNAEGITAVEAVPSRTVELELARRVAAGWSPHPAILRAALSKLHLLNQWMSAEPALATRVATAAEHAGFTDLAVRLRFVHDPRDAAVWADYTTLVQAGSLSPLAIGADAAWTLAFHPDLTERHCRLVRGLPEADRQGILRSLGIVARARSGDEKVLRGWLGLP